MRVVRISRKSNKSLRTVRGFCRVAKVGRLTRAEAVALALRDLADQIREARLYSPKTLALIRAHLLAFKREKSA